MINYKTLGLDTAALAEKCADFIRKEALSFDMRNVEQKGIHDLVSYVDKETEKKLVQGLRKLTPDAGFITEENTVVHEQKDLTWIIDPLDGTTNFVHGIPCYCISLALHLKGKPVVGVVYEVCRNECFYTWHDHPALLNGAEIHVTNTSQLNDSLFATGFPVVDYSRMDEYMKLFDYCMRNTHGVRRLGSAAADLVYVACGRLEGFFEYGLNAWDVAGGAFIVQQAGGVNSDFNGDDNYLFGREIVSCNKLIYDEFMNAVKNCFENK